MRERLCPSAVFVILVLFSLPALADDKTFVGKLTDAAISSAGSKGAEFAVKFVSGWIYNISCKPEQRTDEGSKALCGALGSLSGKSEEEWKANIEKQLKEINGRLDILADGQARIDRSIKDLQSKMGAEFDQVPNKTKVTDIINTIDALWKAFNDEVKNPRREMTKGELERFAREVMDARLSQKLGELNNLLTGSVDNAQPAIRYPFFLGRQKISQVTPQEAWNGLPTYDFAEKKFIYYRGEMQKGYLVYLWAAEIIESECEIKGDTTCIALPVSSKTFAGRFEGYTRDEAEAFDAATHWFLLAYSRPDSDNPNFLSRSYQMELLLMRANYLTSTLLGDGQGAWGEVISAAGDPWDGKITVDCGGRHTLDPVLSYNVPVDTYFTGSSIDWWKRHGAEPVYDEVRFTSNWRIHHYKLEGAKPGPCRVDKALPNGYSLPWVSPNSEVANVTKEKATRENEQKEMETFPVGFFYGLQRAGGTYALADGQNWTVHPAPEDNKSGEATLKDTRYEYVISANHHEGLWVALINKARVEWTFGESLGSQKKEIMNRVWAYNEKRVWFPEGGAVKLNIIQHSACEKVCLNKDREDAFMDYNVQNSEYEPGKMTAVVAVFLDPQRTGEDWETRGRNGIYIDGSYDSTKDRKEKRVADRVSGNARVDPSKAYHLQYVVHFDLKTFTNRRDSTSYFYVGKITPMFMFLTK